MDRRSAHHAADQRLGHRLLGQQQFDQLVAMDRELIEHLGAPQLRLVVQLGRDVVLGDLSALVVRGETEHSHRDQVDHPAEGLFQVRRAGADRQVYRDRLAAEPVADFVQRAEVIGPFAVHLVDQRDPRHVIFVGLTPDGFALCFDSLSGAEYHHAAVEHSQAPLDLGGEIDVARRVDQVDLDVFPGKVDRGGVDRDAPLLLLGVVIGDGCPLVHRSDAMAEAAEEEHPLGDGGFARVDMGDDADVAELLDVLWHDSKAK